MKYKQNSYKMTVTLFEKRRTQGLLKTSGFHIMFFLTFVVFHFVWADVHNIVYHIFIHRGRKRGMVLKLLETRTSLLTID